MELEKIIRNLELKDDINRLTKEELMDKYAYDENSARFFLHTFYNIFVARAGYPLFIYDKYPMLTNMLIEIKDKYPMNDGFETVADEILNDIYREEGYAPSNGEKQERTSQLFYFKAIRLGTFDSKERIDYTKLSTMLHNETVKINECFNKNCNFPNLNDYRFMLKKASKDRDPMKELEIMNEYYDRFPLLKLCHENEFLYTVNELLFSSDVNQDDKSELINLVGNVIDFSLTFSPYNKDKDFDAKEYRRIARVTSRNIKEYERSIERQKAKEKEKIYKKSQSVNKG